MISEADIYRLQAHAILTGDQYLRYLTYAALGHDTRIAMLPTTPGEKLRAVQGCADQLQMMQAMGVELLPSENQQLRSILRSREEAAKARTRKDGHHVARPVVAPGDKKTIGRFVRGLSDEALADLSAEAIADQIVASPPAVRAAAKTTCVDTTPRGQTVSVNSLERQSTMKNLTEFADTATLLRNAAMRRDSADVILALRQLAKQCPDNWPDLLVDAQESWGDDGAFALGRPPRIR